MNTIKIEELAKNEAFLTAVAACENNEEIQKVFAAEGVELTAEEVASFVKSVESNITGELDADDLDAVSGGADAKSIAICMALIGPSVAKKVAVDTIRFVSHVTRPAPHKPCRR